MNKDLTADDDAMTREEASRQEQYWTARRVQIRKEIEARQKRKRHGRGLCLTNKQHRRLKKLATAAGVSMSRFVDELITLRASAR